MVDQFFKISRPPFYYFHFEFEKFENFHHKFELRDARKVREQVKKKMQILSGLALYFLITCIGTE